MIANYHLIVDFARPSKTNTIVVAENDAETRNCNFKLLFDKEPFDMTGVVTATVKGVTQRGATIWDTAQIKTDGEGNYINELSYLLPLAVTENAGNVTMTITLEGDNNQTITSFEFYIRARNTLYNEDDVIDEEDLEGFRDLLVRSQQALARMEEMVERDALPNPFPIRQTVDGYEFEYTGNEIVEVDMDDVAYLGDYAGYVEVTEDDSAAEVALQAAAEAAESARVAAESVEGVDETAQEVRNIVDNLESIIPTANVTKTGHTATITVQDQHGTTTAEVEDGQDGAVGVTPSITAVVTVDDNTGTPSCTVTKTGTDENPTLTFEFENLKGEKGDPGSGSSVEWGEVYGDISDQEDLQDVFSDIHTLGAKNLIPYPYYTASGLTDRGITFTYDSNGVITLSGTQNNTFESTITISYSNHKLVAGVRYILSCETNDNRVFTGLYFTDGEGSHTVVNRVVHYILPDGTEGSYTNNNVKTYETASSTNIGYIIFWLDEDCWGACTARALKGSYTFSSGVYAKIMLRLATDSDGTYQPYAETNYQLTHNKLSYEDNGVLGAKNLLLYPYSDSSAVKSGITITDNGDGTVLLSSGTVGSNNIQWLFHSSGSQKLKLSKGTYILTGCPSGGASSKYYIQLAHGGTVDTWDYGEGAVFRVTQEQEIIGCAIYVKNGIQIPDLLFKPMIRLASDPDDTWQPYAMTNRELTDKVVKADITPTSGSKNLVTSGGVYSYIDTMITQAMSASY